MTFHLVQIPPDAIEGVWRLAAYMLEPSFSYVDGATSAKRELAFLLEQKKQLWMVIEGDPGSAKGVAAAITSLQKNADDSITANIEYFGGENMKEWFLLKSVFETWASDEGCNDIRLWARKGWAKHLPEYKITHYIMRKELT